MRCNLCGVDLTDTEKNMILCEKCSQKANNSNNHCEMVTKNNQDPVFVVSRKCIFAGVWFAIISVIPMFLILAIAKGGHKPSNFSELMYYFAPAPFAALWGSFFGSKIIDSKTEEYSKLKCSWIGIKITFFTVVSWAVAMGLINSSAHSPFVGHFLLNIFMAGIYFSWIVFPLGAIGAVLLSEQKSNTQPEKCT